MFGARKREAEEVEKQKRMALQAAIEESLLREAAAIKKVSDPIERIVQLVHLRELGIDFIQGATLLPFNKDRKPIKALLKEDIHIIRLAEIIMQIDSLVDAAMKEDPNKFLRSSSLQQLSKNAAGVTARYLSQKFIQAKEKRPYIENGTVPQSARRCALLPSAL